MSEQIQNFWRKFLSFVEEAVEAESFQEVLPGLKERYGDDPSIVAASYTGLLVECFATEAGLLATFLLPPEEVPAALAEIRQVLSSLDFRSPRRKLKRDERQYYDRFAAFAGPVFARIGRAMEALLSTYITGDYDPDANPNDLIARALQMAEEDLEQAHRWIAQAGAIALHGRPLWWRWEEEAYGPAAERLRATCILIESYTFGGKLPLGPPEEARELVVGEVRKTLELAKKSLALEESLEEEGEEEEEELISGMIEELFKQGETPLTEEQIEQFRAYREEAVPALIDLVEDEELRAEDAPGEGYAPIHAVRLLGMLGATEAVPTLVDVVAKAELLDIIRDAAIHALCEIGSPALKPVLAFMRYSRNLEAKIALAEVVDEVGEEDEEAYRLMLSVWEGTTWEDGRALLAYALARTGGERAIPVLQQALEDPALEDALDYNTVADALEQLGVEVKFRSVAIERAQEWLEAIRDPQLFHSVMEKAPKEWRSSPERVARAYLPVAKQLILNRFAAAVLEATPEEVGPTAEQLLELVDGLAFDIPADDLPRWARRAYELLADDYREELRHYFEGILLPFCYYPLVSPRTKETPDALIAAARDLPPGSEEARRLFGQAAALTLQGQPLWIMWRLETDPPLSDWLDGALDLRSLLLEQGLLPLRLPVIPPRGLVSEFRLVRGEEEEEEPPPKVKELIELLFERQEEGLTPGDRAAFRRHRKAVAPALLAIAGNPHYASVKAPGAGWAAIMAVRLLGELKVTQAADILASIVVATPPDAVIRDAAILSLMALGRAALHPVQMYLRYGRDPKATAALAEVLGHVGRGDPESFPLLERAWRTTDWADGRRMVALALGDLRDRRAVPLLQEALEDPQADALDLDYVWWALLELGVPAKPPSPPSSHLRTPAPINQRLIYDEDDRPRRLRYTAWGEPLCPDCGRPLIVDEEGDLVHPPEPEPALRARPKQKPKRKKRHHR